jgi:hypothetical protein
LPNGKNVGADKGGNIVSGHVGLEEQPISYHIHKSIFYVYLSLKNKVMNYQNVT